MRFSGAPNESSILIDVKLKIYSMIDIPRYAYIQIMARWNYIIS
jgi:hypothetical protein